jgi:HEAT repeat protein
MQVERGVPLKVTTRETVHVVWGERTLHSRQHLALKLSDTRQIQATLLNSVGWKREPLYATRMPPPESELANVRRKLGNASFSELLADLTAVSKTKDATSQRADAVERMAALFQLHPEALREALRSLKKPLEREEAELLIAALAMSKTPEAQRALSEVANDSALPAGLRQGAVVRLGLQQNPTEATLRSLGDLASGPDAKVRDGALLALGAAARHAADGENSGVAQRYVREIERSARTATGLEQRTLMLSALGNTASLDVLSTVRTALADPDPNVRSSAVSALRLMPGAEVDELIASTLARDPDAGVRRSAADSCGVRPIQGALLAGLVTSLKQEKDAYVRLGVVAALAQIARTSSEVRALLSAVAKDDSAPEVRAAAERAINPNSARER